MWEELYEEHFRELVAYGSRMCGNRELAQDLAQETFVKAQMNGETLESLPPNKRRAWLYRTLKNLFIDFYRRSVLEGQYAQNMQPQFFESSGLQNVENELFLHAVSPQDRTIFLLRYYERSELSPRKGRHGDPDSGDKKVLTSHPGGNIILTLDRLKTREDNMDETLLLVQKIKAMYNTRTFSKSDNAIAEYILANPACLSGSTANSLAEASGTSPATVIRFCRKLGFGGFTELKNSAANYIVETAKDMSLRRGDDVRTVKNKVINYTKLIMDELGEMLDDSALEEAARLISEAKSLVIVSEGGSGTISRAAYDIFLKLAIPCRCIEDLIFQAMEISMMDKDDLLLIIVNSGRTWNVLQNASYAKERGIKIVGIVGPANSPLSKYLDVEILTNVFSSDYFSDISAARACELVTISILHSIIALTRTEEQIEKSHEIGMSIEKKRLSPK